MKDLDPFQEYFNLRVITRERKIISSKAFISNSRTFNKLYYVDTQIILQVRCGTYHKI